MPIQIHHVQDAHRRLLVVLFPMQDSLNVDGAVLRTDALGVTTHGLARFNLPITDANMTRFKLLPDGTPVILTATQAEDVIYIRVETPSLVVIHANRDAVEMPALVVTTTYSHY